MDMEIPQYCRRCGTMLIDGVCPTCPEQAAATAPQPHRPAPAAPPSIAPSAPSATAARTAPTATIAQAPPAADRQPAQPEPQRPWFSSVPTPPVAMRGKGWRYAHMWNWGAFLLCPLWLMNHGRIGRAILFLVLCAVPFLWPFAFCMAVAYGMKGNTVASINRDFVDDAQFVHVQNAWRTCGFGVLLLSVFLALLVGLANMVAAPRGA